MPKTISLLLASLLATFALPANALDLSLGMGRGNAGSDTLRLGAQLPLPGKILPFAGSGLSGHLDLAVSHWHGGRGRDASAVSLAPVLTWEFANGGVRPYIEGGLGLAVFDATLVAGQALGSRAHFESRLGAGLRFGRQEVGLRVLHYSNAGIKDPNEGTEQVGVHYRFRF